MTKFTSFVKYLNFKMKYFIGIDLGWRNKKTTGICILEEKNGSVCPKLDWCLNCKDFLGSRVVEEIKSYLPDTKVIAIDAPLTKGQGKGDMRLFEKFLSTKIFRKEKLNPIPPALMPKLCIFAQEVVFLMENLGFVLNDNLIEVYPTFIQKISGKKLFSLLDKKFKKQPCQSENQKSALICALVAYLHYLDKTRYLGYKDGFLFLPEMYFWQKDWQKKFLNAWNERSFLKYKYLETNIFK